MGLLLMLVVGGCGSVEVADRATVSGTIVFEGKPVTGGSIRLVGADDPTRQAHGRVRKDGTFTLTGCPVGVVKVAVETSSVLEGVPSTDSGEFVRIPPQFVRPETTPLSVTVPAGGAADLTIELR